VNLLVSYYFIRATRDWIRYLDALWGVPSVRWLMDSGAYSVGEGGQPITVEEYAAFCKATERHWWQYITLDVIDNKVATAANLARMVEEFGLRPMPVLTIDEDESVFPSLVDVNPYVCLSGGVTENTTAYGARIERCWRMVGGECKIHGLGFTRPESLAVRCHSFDSSSWRSPIRFGNLHLFDAATGRIVAYPWRKWVRGNRFDALPIDLKELLVAHGVTPDLYASRLITHGEYSFVQLVSLMAWLRYMRLCRSRGVRLFLAVMLPRFLGAIAAVCRHADEAMQWIDWRSAQKDGRWLEAMRKEKSYGELEYIRRAFEFEAGKTRY
jgi:hypothetical protein